MSLPPPVAESSQALYSVASTTVRNNSIDFLNGTTNERSSSMVRVAVGSRNPCKVEAVRSAFTELFSPHTQKKVQITSYDVSSGVSDQPFGDEETKLGAKNRAEAAFRAAANNNDDMPDFAVGLEGGLERRSAGEELWCMAWMAILGTNSSTCCSIAKSPIKTPVLQTMWGFGKTATFLLPSQLTHLILNHSMELGDADDLVFGRTNGKQGSGTVGLLTGGSIDRKEYYIHAIQLAFIPWIWPNLYYHIPNDDDNCEKLNNTE